MGVDQLDLDGAAAARVFDGARFPMGELQSPCAVDMDAPEERVDRAQVRFVTPTELKSEHQVAERPEFGILFGRLRDRISTLRARYGDGPLEIDFRAMGERAGMVRMTRCELRWHDVDRQSSRTGQRHPLGGFAGEAEYEGDLGEFVGYLRAGKWVGVGRQTVWGKGEVEVRFG